MDKLTEKVVEFTRERDWDQFHSPENLAKSIFGFEPKFVNYDFLQDNDANSFHPRYYVPYETNR